MLEQPEPYTARYAQLMELAHELLKPSPGQKVLIMAVDAEEADQIRATFDPEELEEPEQDGNVVPLFGQPHLTGEDERRELRSRTSELLLELAERAERGEIRDVAIVAGVENNERYLNNVETLISSGVTMHLPMFLGGLSLLKEHVMDAFELGCDPDLMGEDEIDG